MHLYSKPTIQNRQFINMFMEVQHTPHQLISNITTHPTPLFKTALFYHMELYHLIIHQFLHSIIFRKILLAVQICPPFIAQNIITQDITKQWWILLIFKIMPNILIAVRFQYHGSLAQTWMAIWTSINILILLCLLNNRMQTRIVLSLLHPTCRIHISCNPINNMNKMLDLEVVGRRKKAEKLSGATHRPLSTLTGREIKGTVWLISRISYEQVLI